MAPTRANSASPSEEAAPEPAPKVAKSEHTNRALAAHATYLAETEGNCIRRPPTGAGRIGVLGKGVSQSSSVSSGLFPGVTRNQNQAALKKKNQVIIRDHHNQILTNEERYKLASWLIQCA